MRRPLTDRDWEIVTEYAMHGSLREVAWKYGMNPESVRRRVKRIAPQLLQGSPRSRLMGGYALRHVTREYWEKRKCQTTTSSALAGRA